MKDEIKEILFLLHNDRLTESGKRKLEDYITNLQERNEKLKELKNLYREKFISNFCANNRAIKCIEDFLCTEEYIKSDPEATANNSVELLNILKSETQENLYKYTPEKGFRLVGDENE